MRFAPSPTGFLHVGSARTALFNWIYARSVGGEMLLRVEDTDAERNRPELLKGIFELLEWLGIDWDAEAVFQSSRREHHREAVERLLSSGAAYLCDADDRPVAGSTLADGLAVRFRTPPGRSLEFVDAVRGSVSFRTDDLEDFVIWRSVGSPTFLLANAVDDAAMGVTHAIRGEDLLSGTPRALLLMEALGEHPPDYAHLPLLVNAERKKLSKRRDDVSLGDYRSRGYVPEAVANYLALLGWGPPDGVEIRSMSEIVSLFRLEDINKAPAFFDLKKLEHFNAVHIRSMRTESFLERATPWLGSGAARGGEGERGGGVGERAAPAARAAAGGDSERLVGDGEAPWPPERFRSEVMEELAPVVQGKVRTLADVPRFVDWLFLEDPPDDPESWQAAMSQPYSADLLAEAERVFGEVTWTAEAVHEAAKALAERHGLKLGKAQAPLRVALTGRKVGPPLFESMVLLEREEVLRRLRRALSRLEG